MSDLYHYATYFLTKDTSDFLYCSLKELNHGSKYLLHELPLVPFEYLHAGAPVRLISQHISLHEKVDVFNPCLSAYHYTANFVHQDRQYRLHVYFDRKDQLLLLRYANKTSESESIELVSTIKEKLLNLAIIQTGRFIRPCRARRAQQLKADLDVTNSLIKSFNALSYEQNAQHYSSLLNEIIAAYEGIFSYSRESRHYNQFQMYKRIKNTQRRVIKDSPKQEFADLTSLQDDDEPIVFCQEVATPQKRIRLPFHELLHQRQTEFQQFKERMALGELSIHIPKLQRLSAKIHQLTCLIAEKEYKVMEEDHRQLDLLLRDVDTLRIEIFKKLLIYRSFDSAASLLTQDANLFTSDDVSSFVALALRTANAQLLDFLLTHFDFPINTTEYNAMSPVMYCFVKNSKERSMRECLGILIKHQASLIEQVPNSSLSIMEVLYHPEHPLHSVLNLNQLSPSRIELLERRAREEEFRIGIRRGGHAATVARAQKTVFNASEAVQKSLCKVHELRQRVQDLRAQRQEDSADVHNPGKSC